MQDVLHVLSLLGSLFLVYKVTTQCKSIEFFCGYNNIKIKSNDNKELNQVGNFYLLNVEISNN